MGIGVVTYKKKHNILIVSKSIISNSYIRNIVHVMFFVDFSISSMNMTGRKYWVHAEVLQEHSQVYKGTVVIFAVCKSILKSIKVLWLCLLFARAFSSL